MKHSEEIAALLISFLALISAQRKYDETHLPCGTISLPVSLTIPLSHSHPPLSLQLSYPPPLSTQPRFLPSTVVFLLLVS